MAGGQASSAALLAAAAAGFVVAGFPADAQGQALPQQGVIQPSGTIPPRPVASQSSTPAQQAAQLQNTLLNPGVQQPQQGVAIPQRPASRPRQIDVQLFAAGIYDSNATRTNALRASQSGLSQSDFRFPLGVNLDIFLPTGPNAFTLNGIVGYDFNVRNSQRNRENINLNAGFQRTLHACSTLLGARYQRSSTALGNANQLILPVNNVETKTGFDGTLTCGSVGGARPFASAAYSNGRNSDLVRKFSDYNTTTFGGGVTFGQPSFVEFGLVASIDDTKYPNRAGLLLSSGFKASSIGFSVNRAAARHLRTQVQLNYTSVKNSGPGKSFTGISGQGNVTFIPGGRFVFDVSFARAASPSLSTTSDYNLTTDMGFSVSAAISPKTDVSVNFHNQDRKYIAAVYNPIHPLTDDTLRTIDASISHQLTPRLHVDASVSRQNRRANDPFFDFSGMLYAIHASLSL